MSVHNYLWLPAVLALFAVSGAGIAADSEGGHSKGDAPHDQAWVEEKVQVCASCHGADGVSPTGNFPTIAGQYENYLVHSLKQYRDGERKNGIMAVQAKGLTDAQIKALAKHYSRLESPLYTPALGE